MINQFFMTEDHFFGLPDFPTTDHGFYDGVFCRNGKDEKLHLVPPKKEWSGASSDPLYVPDEREWVAYLNEVELHRNLNHSGIIEHLRTYLKNTYGVVRVTTNILN